MKKNRRDSTSGSDEEEEETDEEAKADGEALRTKADRLIAEYKKARRHDPTNAPPDLPAIRLKSISDYESGDGHEADEGPPAAEPKQMIVSIDTPLNSALRVRPLLANFKTIGDDMQNKRVLIKGRQTVLTANHRNIWFAFLALTPQDIQYLEDSMNKLAEKKGWSLSKAKRLLADAFVFFQEHRLFEECCDLMVSTRESKHMDEGQRAKVKTNAKKLLLGEVPRYSDTQEKDENARDLFRKVIHQWIEEYGHD